MIKTYNPLSHYLVNETIEEEKTTGDYKKYERRPTFMVGDMLRPQLFEDNDQFVIPLGLVIDVTYEGVTVFWTADSPAL